MSTHSRRRRVEELCDAALSRPPAERGAFLAVACGDDPGLRHEVEALLAHAQTADAFLEQPVGAVAAALLADEPGALAGRQLGAYRIVSFLGAGGMGEVYRAHDSRLRRDVAVKILPSSVAADPSRIARFEREARMLAALNHPHIGAIYGIEESEVVVSGLSRPLTALVLELVEGPTLADRLRAGPIPVTEALTIARHIAEALEAAHEKGIVHRDLKPANIKITPTGTVKVLDFGLGKVFAADERSDHSPTVTLDRTGEGMLVGTPAYMSPEQVAGQPVDKRTDIWAFGCVLYEMLAGAPAFAGSSVSEILGAVLKLEIAWNALPSRTPVTVRALLRRCLQRDAKQRLHDIADARLEIEEVLTAPEAEPPLSTTPSRGRGGLVLAALGGTVAVAAVAVAFTIYLGRPAERNAPPTYQSSILPPSGTTVANLPFQRFALSPDGRQLALATRTETGLPQLWVQPLDGRPARMLGIAGVTPFWSPDSRFVGYYAGDLYIAEAAGGPPRKVADVGTGNPGATWSRDNVILFSGTGDGRAIMRVSPAGGDVTAVTTVDRQNGETQHWAPFFLPDGRHFLYVAVGTTTGGPAAINGIYVAALDSKERKLLVPGGASPRYSQGHLLFLRDQTLLAQPFDVGRLELTADAVAVAEQVAIGGMSGRMGAVSVSDSDLLVYQRGSGGDMSQLVWADRTGRQLGTLGDLGSYGDVALAPDGQRAAVTLPNTGSDRDIWLFEIARGLRTRFTFDLAEQVAPVWSPDGSQTIFTSLRKGNPDIYLKASSGVGTEEAVLVDPAAKYPMSWSLDGRFMLYARTASVDSQDIWVLPLAGDRKPFPFTQTRFTELAAAFSPDGRWIAYVSDESGRSEVYVVPFPGPGGRWQVSTAGGNWPRWRRDGGEIFYIDPAARLMAADVRGASSGFDVGAVRLLFETRAVLTQRYMYDVSPDGQRFLINMSVQQAVQPITLVVNWPALLKQ